MTMENANQPGVGAVTDTTSEQDEQMAYSSASAGSDASTGHTGTAVAVEEKAAAEGQAAVEDKGAEGAAAETKAAVEDKTVVEAKPDAEAHTNSESESSLADQNSSMMSSESGAGQDFGAMLDTYEKESAASIEEGEVVRGIVVDISDQNVLVDIGYKSEGVVPREELTDRNSNVTVKPGDQIDVLIKSLENEDGYAVLSRVDAVRMKAWDHLRLAHQNHETVTGRVIDRIKGGLKVDVDGVIAFLPGSPVDVRPV